jgi:intron-binding protein aquarius
MLRLGSGEKDLVGHEDFSKPGRIQWCLARRLQLLEQVQRLGSALGIPGDVGSSCETSGYFFLEHIQTRIEKFEHDLRISQNTNNNNNNNNISQIFPFGNFFWDIQSSLFTGIHIYLTYTYTTLNSIE